MHVSICSVKSVRTTWTGSPSGGKKKRLIQWSSPNPTCFPIKCPGLETHLTSKSNAFHLHRCLLGSRHTRLQTKSLGALPLHASARTHGPQRYEAGHVAALVLVRLPLIESPSGANHMVPVERATLRVTSSQGKRFAQAVRDWVSNHNRMRSAHGQNDGTRVHQP